MKCIINELNMRRQQWNGISLSAGGMSHTNYWPSLGLKLKSPTVQHDAEHVELQCLQPRSNIQGLGRMNEQWT